MSLDVLLQLAGESFQRDLTLVLAGALLGVGGNWVVYRIRRRNQKRDLAGALVVEMNSTEALDDWIENYPHHGRRHAPAIDTIPKDVYRNNTDRLGLFPEPPRRKVIEYYTFAQIVAQQVELLNRRAEAGQHEEDDYDTLHESAEELRERRDRAVGALGGELS